MRITPSAEQSLLVKSGWTISRTWGNKRVKQGSFSHVTVGESLIPNIEPSFLWLANIEVARDHANDVGFQRPAWSDEAYPPGQNVYLLNSEE